MIHTCYVIDLTISHMWRLKDKLNNLKQFYQLDIGLFGNIHFNIHASNVIRTNYWKNE